MTTRNLSNDPKARILETACRLFYEQGYHLTGINQLIAEAAVAKASFYQHFSSKEELCIAYLQERHNSWFAGLRKEVESHKTAYQRLLSVFTFLENWVQVRNYRGCAFQNAISEFPDPDSPIRKKIETHKTARRDYIQQLVQSLANETTDSIDVAAIASTICLLYEGALVESQFYRSTQPIQAAREAVERMLGQKQNYSQATKL